MLFTTLSTSSSHSFMCASYSASYDFLSIFACFANSSFPWISSLLFSALVPSIACHTL